MTTPSRYPTVEEVRGVIATGPLVFLETNRAMVEAAINIERERVEKEAGEYFRCDECHEPAGTRQVCRRCVRLEIERDGGDESQNSAVKVPDDVMESAEFLAQWCPGHGLYRDHASAILSFLQSLTHPTEPAR